MANGEVRAEDMTEETSVTLSGNEQLVMFDSVEGKRCDIDVAADYITGGKANLNTTDKSSLVAGINEVKGETTDLKADLNADKKGIVEPILVDGKYVNSSTGDLSNSSDYTATDYIDINGWDILAFWFDSAGNRKYNCFYDSAKAKTGDAFTTRTGLNIITIPSGAQFVRLSEQTTKMATLRIYTPNGYTAQNAEKIAESLLSGMNDGTMTSPTLYAGYISSSDGSDASSSSYKRTEYIDVSAYSKMYFAYDTSMNQSYNAFYDTDKAFISNFATTAGINIVDVPSGAKYMRLSETNANIATLKLYFPELYKINATIVLNKSELDGKIGTLSELPTSDKSSLVNALKDSFGVAKTTNTLDGYTINNGCLVYDNGWYQYNNSNYKHAVIPITSRKTIVRITAGASQCFIGALKSYTKPTTSSHDNPTLSDYWNNRVDIPVNGSFAGLVPQDANYLVVNTLYNGVPCISSFSLEEVAYDESPAVKEMAHSFHNIDVSAHNVRDFSDGSGDGCPDNLVSTNLPLWKDFATNWINTDFLAIDEWYPYFDRSQTIDAYSEIFEQFFPYKYELPVSAPVRIILSKHAGIITDLAFFADVHFTMPMIICNINGKTLAVVCWIQSNADTIATRIANYEKAIVALAQYDFVIVAGDFNTEEGLGELATWTNAGYTLGNGGYWGEIKTWENLTPNDNIVTKGFVYKKFEAGDNVTSDHKAVRAFLSCDA